MIDRSFWQGRRVFITGHTGFKGSWLSFLLNRLGATVIGYSQPPNTTPNLFNLLSLDSLVESHVDDIRDLKKLTSVMQKSQPDVVIHMAAQALVRPSYNDPVDTYATNVMGTVNLLEAIRHTESVRAVVNVTTDKCYDNQDWVWGYRENDRLGGGDPYSNSKACSELVTDSYRRSFFAESDVAIATARAGNVIGGGDWSKDRLIPDVVRSIESGEPLNIRYPQAVRPWQHVLEPLVGYLKLAENLYRGDEFAQGGWNFGPDNEQAKPVEWILTSMKREWPGDWQWIVESAPQLHEANYLKLDSSKAKTLLGWQPKLAIEDSIKLTAEWYRAFFDGQSMVKLTEQQIKQYIELGE